jgi:hypothetical protein
MQWRWSRVVSGIILLREIEVGVREEPATLA